MRIIRNNNSLLSFFQNTIICYIHIYYRISIYPSYDISDIHRSYSFIEKIKFIFFQSLIFSIFDIIYIVLYYSIIK